MAALPAAFRGTPGKLAHAAARADWLERVAAKARPRWSADRWLLVGLALVGVLSRVFGTNSLAGEPTSDEFHFGLYARDLARAWASGAGWATALEALGQDGRLLAIETAALAFFLPGDAVTLGRTIQALLNALCVPLTFWLGRQLGLPRAPSLAAAVLLLAAREFHEFAWRFWSDSQATFLGLLYLGLLARYARRRRLLAAAAAAVTLAVLFLTKDSAAVGFAPLLPLVLLVVLTRALRTWRARLVLGGLLVLGGVVAALVVLYEPVAERLRVASFGRLLLYGAEIFGAVERAPPKLAPFAERLVAIFGPFEMSEAFLWAWALGSVWVAARALRALAQLARGHVRSRWRSAAAWSLAALLWLPLAAIPLHHLRALGRVELWVSLAVATALLLVAALLNGRHDTLRDERTDSDDAAPGWGLALAGSLVLALTFVRLLVWVTPGLDAALTIRTFMPVQPLLALVAGVGLSGAVAGAARLLPAPAGRLAPVGTVLLAALLVATWSPLVQERLTGEPLLGRPAVRGADPEKAEGLLVVLLADAEGWLQANLRPSDRIAATHPRHVAWYADLPAEALDGMVNLRTRSRDPADQLALLREQKGPQRRSHVDERGLHYVVSFNEHWTKPDSEAAQLWRLTYEWLASLPHMEVAYLRHDRYGHPVLYVVRNHGYATPTVRQG